MILRALIFALVLSACGQQQDKQTPPSEGAAPTVSMSDETAQSAPVDEVAFDAQILAWARSIYNVDGPNLIEPVDTFYGDFNGDGAPDGLAFAYYETGGSGFGLNVALFQNRDGRMVYLRSVDEVLGAEPRDARFERGRVYVTTSTLGPGDAHCCPTKPHEWVINTR